jgi:hypothetical protein
LIINNVGGYSTTMLLCPEIAERWFGLGLPMT